MFINFAIFKNISFETIEKFKEDLMKISRQVEEIISKFLIINANIEIIQEKIFFSFFLTRIDKYIC